MFSLDWRKTCSFLQRGDPAAVGVADEAFPYLHPHSSYNSMRKGDLFCNPSEEKFTSRSI